MKISVSLLCQQNQHRCVAVLAITVSLVWLTGLACAQSTPDLAPQPFGEKFPNLDSDAVGEWWKPTQIDRGKNKGQTQQPKLLVPRNQVMAFALYTHDHGILKLSAQLYPLKPDEPRTVTLEFQDGDLWKTVAESPVLYPGWSAQFRIENWDNTKTVEYRVRLGDQSSFAGTIRKDPIDKQQIVAASLSCNSSRTPGPRATIVDNLKKLDPDLLFFAGDQSYHHTQHTHLAGWNGASSFPPC
jgi:hypothetical protein